MVYYLLQVVALKSLVELAKLSVVDSQLALLYLLAKLSSDKEQIRAVAAMSFAELSLSEDLKVPLIQA